ncbi:hypothetical protein NC661_15565 [Aquibacillus koreensis]|uniref:YhfM-like domain-containing protein n=1 Tax=Aquibacillus koreensis TaxID=279446 RepID=A0A9X3WP79_9BACI|nr:hypothetical protein [Aquibacillus koreensis]MCT2534484.1 hypothetical protein [Aquibacillus koreensis]MDC3421791.1 hypothetical protein [Aquibacillus koreensis]
MKWIFTIGVLMVLTACQTEVETMVLLDEKIGKVEVSESNGVGDVNTDILEVFKDDKSIQTFQDAIETAVMKQIDVEGEDPDYDLMVLYEEGYPSHPIHLWLGEEGEPSTLSYVVGEGETYLTTEKATQALREMLLSE